MADLVDPDVRRVEAELGTLIRRSRVFARQAAAEVHPDLAGAGFSILARLVDHGAMRASALVEAFGIDKAAISRQVSQLEQLGLVTRERDPADRRAQTVSVTAEGRERCLQAREKSRYALRWQLEQWAPEDVHALGSLLGKLNEIDLFTRADPPA